jgi:hypothetical protein
VNGIGAIATGITLAIVLVAKFAEGAWVTVLLIPLMLVTFGAVRRHYTSVAQQIATDEPLDVANIRPPIVIIPMRDWNKMSQKGLRFALRLSPEIYVVQVKTGGQDESDLDRHWKAFVEDPVVRAGLPVPALVEVESPYRHVFTPMLDYILAMKRRNCDRQIAVLIPELVARRWYHNLLHNKRAAMLKALLLVRGGDDIVVINVPWYLNA